MISSRRVHRLVLDQSNSIELKELDALPLNCLDSNASRLDGSEVPKPRAPTSRENQSIMSSVKGAQFQLRSRCSCVAPESSETSQKN
jgi:hypothetical protein